MTIKINPLYSLPALAGLCVGYACAASRAVDVKTSVAVRPGTIDWLFYQYPVQTILATAVAGAILACVGVYLAGKYDEYDKSNLDSTNKENKNSQ